MFLVLFVNRGVELITLFDWLSKDEFISLQSSITDYGFALLVLLKVVLCFVEGELLFLEYFSDIKSRTPWEGLYAS